MSNNDTREEALARAALLDGVCIEPLWEAPFQMVQDMLEIAEAEEER